MISAALWIFVVGLFIFIARQRKLCRSRTWESILNSTFNFVFRLVFSFYYIFLTTYFQLWMAPAAPQNCRPQELRFWEAGGFDLLRNTFGYAINGNADWVCEKNYVRSKYKLIYFS